MRSVLFQEIICGLTIALTLSASAYADTVFNLNPAAWTLLSVGAPYPDKSILSYLYYYNLDYGYRLSFTSRSAPIFDGSVAVTVPGYTPSGQGYNAALTFGTTSLSQQNLFTSLQFSLVASNPEAISCYYILNGITTFLNGLHSGENVITIPGVSVTGYQSIVCSNISISEVDLVVTKLAAVSPISPSPTPSPSPSSTPTPASYALRATFTDSTAPKVSGDVSIVKILPSTDGCGALKTEFHQRSFLVQCVDKSSEKVVSGCQLNTNIKLGADHGGHEHDIESRPLGALAPKISASKPFEIPLKGLPMVYESPQVAGDVDLTLSGYDPNGKPLESAGIEFQVTRGDFEALRASGFHIEVDSHTDGDRGTARMQAALERLLQLFTERTAIVHISQTLESEAGSLPHGGLFDYKKTWVTPHCGHRDGNTIDLSYSMFDSYGPTEKLYLIAVLEKSISQAGMTYKYEVGDGGRHWHLHLR